MQAKVICITREFGSGGRTIGKMLADALGYDFYDWNLVQEIAESSGFAKEFIEENGETTSSILPWLFKSGNGPDITDQLYMAQRDVIIRLAEKGNCVIVGRCADYILRERNDVLSCFIYADEAFKRNRIINTYGETEVAIDKRMKDKDRKRKAHYQYYTGRKWGLTFYYDVALNSGRLGIEQCAAVLTFLAKNFEASPKMADPD